MKVICLGLDPAGLYLAALLKQSGVARDVEIVEGPGVAAPASPHVMAHPLKPGPGFADDKLDHAIKSSCRTVRGVRIHAAQVDRSTDNQTYAFIDAVTLTDPVAIPPVILIGVNRHHCERMKAEFRHNYPLLEPVTFAMISMAAAACRARAKACPTSAPLASATARRRFPCTSGLPKSRTSVDGSASAAATPQ
jgi:hypothetical protein